MPQETAGIKDFYQSVLTHLDEGVYYVDKSRQILYWNKGAERLSGYSQDEVVGMYCHDNLLEHVDENGVCLCLNSCPLAATIEDGKKRKANVFLHHKKGHRVPITVQTLPVRNAESEIFGALEVFLENPEKVSNDDKMKELAKLAFWDNCTGLPNQNYLMVKLKAVLEDMKRCKTPYGVIMERIDNYTQLGDSFSKTIVDRVLNTAGNTLQSNITSSSVVGRWDHQTFLIITPSINLEMMEMLSRRLARLVEQSTFTVDKKTAKGQLAFRFASLGEASNEKEMLEPLLRLPYQK